MYPHQVPNYTSGTHANASPTNAPSSPTYAPSSPLSESFTPPPAPQLRPATPHHLSEPIVIDCDEDDISLSDTIADSSPPQLCGPSATPPANFGFTQLRRALENHVSKSAEQQDKVYETLSEEMMHPQDRNPSLLRQTSLSTSSPAIKSILLLSPFPGELHEHRVARHLANSSCAAHPDWEVLDLYAHLATWVSHSDLAIAKREIAPVDLYACKRTLQSGMGVHGLLGKRVLERLMAERVKQGGRKFVVLGFALNAEEAVRAWRIEINRPQAVVACIHAKTLQQEGFAQFVRDKYGQQTLVIPLLADMNKNLTAFNGAIMSQVYEDGTVPAGHIFLRKDGLPVPAIE
ncbi:hypothetical protein B0A48_07025 [Cryoendolithus antarcticus]|uniref:Uncharacterized protein n=1 Tax=Cryoendolithus antarcticus TaxID=1507870 RepID=A0A1V8T7X6_9PEZI|nr:hypothetical protein B0A48_07025 [Cryoendolithus antarcticus]